jgi:starch phosphorylase
MTANAPGLPLRTDYCPVDATSAVDEPTLDKDSLRHAFYTNLFYVQGKIPTLATRHDYYLALAVTVRDQMLHRWISTAEAYTKHGSRTVAYFSAEFLMGPHLGNNILNLGLEQVARQVLTEVGLDYDDLLECEDEPGLGNGGLGRLAACFLDSLATLQIPTIGYGIRYEFGIFQQEIVDGWQVEKTDKWLRFGNAWEIPRPEWAIEVKLGGYTERYSDEHERVRTRWVPQRTVVGVPYYTPIIVFVLYSCMYIVILRV